MKLCIVTDCFFSLVKLGFVALVLLPTTQYVFYTSLQHELCIKQIHFVQNMVYSPVCFAEIWLKLICCERKTPFVRYVRGF
jgi:hypothetical protein